MAATKEEAVAALDLVDPLVDKASKDLPMFFEKYAKLVKDALAVVREYVEAQT
jgi:hypothetical protein